MKILIKNHYLLFRVICFILLMIQNCFYGCATSELTNIRDDYDFNKESSKSIIIGKIDIDQSGVIGFCTKKIVKVICNSITDIDHPNPCHADAQGNTWLAAGDYFFISLPEGHYYIESLTLGYGIFGLFGLSGSLDAQVFIGKGFIVGAKKEIIYVGDLNVKCKFHLLSSPPELITSEVNVVDEYDAALSEFNKKYPQIKDNVTKELFK
jgi:hypothetical protein